MPTEIQTTPCRIQVQTLLDLGTDWILADLAQGEFCGSQVLRKLEFSAHMVDYMCI